MKSICIKHFAINYLSAILKKKHGKPNGSDNPDGRQLNRRVTFKIIGLVPIKEEEEEEELPTHTLPAPYLLLGHFL
jgi:hypothetical protein